MNRFSVVTVLSGSICSWNQQALDPTVDPECRYCEEIPETGKHIVLSCIAREWMGRRWSLWVQADERERWLRKRKDRAKEVLRTWLRLIRGWVLAVEVSYGCLFLLGVSVVFS